MAVALKYVGQYEFLKPDLASAIHSWDGDKISNIFLQGSMDYDLTKEEYITAYRALCTKGDANLNAVIAPYMNDQRKKLHRSGVKVDAADLLCDAIKQFDGSTGAQLYLNSIKKSARLTSKNSYMAVHNAIAAKRDEDKTLAYHVKDSLTEFMDDQRFALNDPKNRYKSLDNALNAWIGDDLTTEAIEALKEKNLSREAFFDVYATLVKRNDKSLDKLVGASYINDQKVQIEEKYGRFKLSEWFNHAFSQWDNSEDSQRYLSSLFQYDLTASDYKKVHALVQTKNKVSNDRSLNRFVLDYLHSQHSKLTEKQITQQKVINSVQQEVDNGTKGKLSFESTTSQVENGDSARNNYLPHLSLGKNILSKLMIEELQRQYEERIDKEDAFILEPFDNEESVKIDANEFSDFLARMANDPLNGYMSRGGSNIVKFNAVR